MMQLFHVRELVLTDRAGSDSDSSVMRLKRHRPLESVWIEMSCDNVNIAVEDLKMAHNNGMLLAITKNDLFLRFIRFFVMLHIFTMFVSTHANNCVCFLCKHSGFLLWC